MNGLKIPVIIFVAAVAILFLFFVIRYIKNRHNELKKLKEEEDFMMDRIEIPLNNVEQIFKDVTIVYSIQETNEKTKNFFKAFDLSCYSAENRVIGLICFAQAQSIARLNTLLNSDMSIGKDGIAYSGILPHCSVYKLKDGRWLWRPKPY